MEITKKYLNHLSNEVIKCAIKVHSTLGPGLLESIYEKCMMIELERRGIKARRQVNANILYEGHEIETELRLDILVEDILSVELKSKEAIPPVDIAILLSYMEMLKSPKGVLINFHCKNIKYEGQKTYVNKYYSELNDF